MPHRPIDVVLQPPAWVERLEDSCLQQTVIEALVARWTAIKNGAEHHRACKAALVSGKTILENIATGRVTGELACKRAADALRKFTTAVECAHPTAQRSDLRGARKRR